jgi:two-component system, LytTR family, response regulator
MISAILIDDEKASLVALEAKLMDCEQDIKILATFQNPVEALSQVLRLDADVLFLDVDMPNLDGFGFLNRLPERPFEVVFTTAYNQYAINAIRSEALDFLLKPINQDELSATIAKIIQRKTERNLQNKRSTLNKISVPTQKGLQFLPKDEIVYVEADKNYTTFFMNNQPAIVVSKTMKEFEKILENIGFFRIHHSTIINLHHIIEYVKGEGGSVIMSNGTELEVSRRRKQEFLERIQS